MPTPTPISVLSYNICFEAMTHNSGERYSAHLLGARCPEVHDGTGLTRCGHNTAAAIDAMPATLGVGGFDVVGLQEASRWRKLQPVSAALAGMTPVGTMADHTEMVSFYDPGRYTLAHPATGAFDAYAYGRHGTKVRKTDRPYVILVLRETATGDGLIFVNCHCPHSSATRGSSGPSYAHFSTVAADLGAALATLPLTAAEKAYRIVVVGDCNDAGWQGTLAEPNWTPFADAGIPTAVALDASRFSSPVSPAEGLLTCCQPDGRWADASGALVAGWRGGDYIFDSAAAAPTRIPALPATAFDLTSDHLPVVALLP